MSLEDGLETVPGVAAGSVTLEFGLEATATARLWRHALVQALRTGAVRQCAHNIVWHDTADGALAGRGLVIAEDLARGGLWRLEPLYPGAEPLWLPASPPPVLAEALGLQGLELQGLGPKGLMGPLASHLAGPMAPAAAFRGRKRSVAMAFPGGAGTLCLVAGELRGVAQEQPACRLQITGTGADCAALAIALSETLALRVPLASLAAEALALARGVRLRARRLGAPSIPPDLTAGEALQWVCAHLADVILHWGACISDTESPEPVHQMRVGVRRLRSALSTFRRAVEDEAGVCAWLDEMGGALRELAGRLGEARDWDVFTTETGAEVASAFPADRRVGQMLAAAERKRAAAYASLNGYLASQAWTQLSVRLAVLPAHSPWMAPGPAGGPGAAMRVRDYAAHALDRRLKHVLAPGLDLSGLPVEQLHEIRKQAKRLRYATECFAPLFGEKAVRKYLPRLANLQAALGAVNDADVAAGLTRQLEGGADRAFAAGVVQGFGAARAAGAQARVQRVWRKFYKAAPFWD